MKTWCDVISGRKYSVCQSVGIESAGPPGCSALMDFRSSRKLTLLAMEAEWAEVRLRKLLRARKHVSEDHRASLKALHDSDLTMTMCKSSPSLGPVGFPLCQWSKSVYIYMFIRQRNRTNSVCVRARTRVCVFTLRYLTYVICDSGGWQVQKLQGQPAGWRPGKSGYSNSSIKAVCSQNSLLLSRGQSFVFFRPSTYYIRPTHVMDSSLFYSKSTDFNIDFIPKRSHRHIQNNV